MGISRRPNLFHYRHSLLLLLSQHTFHPAHPSGTNPVLAAVAGSTRIAARAQRSEQMARNSMSQREQHQWPLSIFQFYTFDSWTDIHTPPITLLHWRTARCPLVPCPQSQPVRKPVEAFIPRIRWSTLTGRRSSNTDWCSM